MFSLLTSINTAIGCGEHHSWHSFEEHMLRKHQFACELILTGWFCGCWQDGEEIQSSLFWGYFLNCKTNFLSVLYERWIETSDTVEENAI